MYQYHIFFIYSSVDRHLGCFHVLAIINSASMNMGVHDICPGVELQDHMVQHSEKEK